MKNILPFIYPPIVDTYSGIASHVGIYMNYPKEYMSLLIANHFLITYDKNKKEVGFNWEYYNDEYNHLIDIRKEAKGQGVICTIKKYITIGKYIRILLDFYYISNSPWYHKKHILHYIPTIIGFDDENECVYLADNLNFGKYEIIQVAYSEIEEARRGHEKEIFEYYYFESKIDYTLTKEYLQILVTSYVDGVCYIEPQNTRNKNNIIYGIEIYKILQDTVKKTFSYGEIEYDIRTFHALINHMDICKIMINNWIDNTEYIKNFKNKEIIGKEYEVLHTKASIIENLYLKMMLSKQAQIRDILLYEIDNLMNQESITLTKLLDALRE